MNFNILRVLFCVHIIEYCRGVALSIFELTYFMFNVHLYNRVRSQKFKPLGHRHLNMMMTITTIATANTSGSFAWTLDGYQNRWQIKADKIPENCRWCIAFANKCLTHLRLPYRNLNRQLYYRLCYVTILVNLSMYAYLIWITMLSG